MRNIFTYIQSANDLVIYKDIRILGWAKTKLYDCSVIHRVKLLLYSIFYSTDHIITPATSDIDIFFFWSDRFEEKGHTKEMLVTMIEALGERNVAGVKLTETFNLSEVYSKIKYCFGYFRTYRSFGSGVYDSLLMAFCAARGRVETDKIYSFSKKKFSRKKCVLTFCDAIGIENLIAQFAKKYGVKTGTIQHGQYRILDDSNMSADAEAYANFVSDVMFTWGEETIIEMQKYSIPRQRFVVCGRLSQPRQECLMKSWSSNHFGLVLSGENQVDFNRSLLNFANGLAAVLNCTYSIRMHPSNPVSKYKKEASNRCLKIEKVSEDIKYYDTHDFSIMGMSGFFLDCIDAQHPFLFFDDGFLSDVFVRSGLTVSSASQVGDKLRQFSISRFSELAIKYNYRIEQKNKIIQAIDELCSD